MYVNSKTVETFFRNIATGISSLIEHWEGFQRIAEKLANLPDRAYSEIYKEYAVDEDGFNVLTHADLWINNIMFRNRGENNVLESRWVICIYLISIFLNPFIPGGEHQLELDVFSRLSKYRFSTFGRLTLHYVR